MTESEWAVWCLSCASTWLGASPYGALPLAVPVKARLQRREILQEASVRRTVEVRMRVNELHGHIVRSSSTRRGLGLEALN